ncbi:MAG: glycosyltransferase family 4 protein [Candidatus Omnitrophica bacterium]|nr:glycosyltransferase family 4 protein [Candidatus Omnitrophota bacterium]
MNILFLVNHLNVGGITSYILTLGKGLKAKGHRVIVASGGGALMDRMLGLGFECFVVPLETKSELSPKILKSFFILRKLIKKENIDIIHSHSRTTQVLAALLSRRAKTPRVFTCHGFFKPRLFRRLFPLWGDKIIAISHQVDEHLVRDFEVSGEDIEVVHNGVDISRFGNIDLAFRGQERQKLGLRDSPVVGIVARLSDVKGHVYLLAAMKTVIDKIPGAQLLIVGEGRMKDELVQRASELAIDNSVYFVAHSEDTRKILAAIDVFVMPSLQEGLGLALMEAMAAGLAVVGSDIGGIKALINDGENGLLVSPADTERLAKAILELLQDEEKRKRFGREAAKFMAANFSQEKMVRETERIYLECLNKKAG